MSPSSSESDLRTCQILSTRELLKVSSVNQETPCVREGNYNIWEWIPTQQKVEETTWPFLKSCSWPFLLPHLFISATYHNELSESQASVFCILCTSAFVWHATRPRTPNNWKDKPNLLDLDLSVDEAGFSLQTAEHISLAVFALCWTGEMVCLPCLPLRMRPISMSPIAQATWTHSELKLFHFLYNLRFGIHQSAKSFTSTHEEHNLWTDSCFKHESCCVLSQHRLWSFCGSEAQLLLQNHWQSARKERLFLKALNVKSS